MLLNSTPGYNISLPNIYKQIQAMINTTLKAYIKGKSGSFSQVAAAQTTFTVTLIAAQQNANYGVIVTPSNSLSSPPHYVNNKTTTSFDVVYPGALTGTVAFDWALTN